MKLNTTGRHVTLKENFLQRVEKRMSKLNRYFTEEAEAFVTTTVTKERQTVEITVKDRGLVLRSERTADSMEEAFDLAIDVVERQLVKNRTKLIDRLRKEGQEALFSEYVGEPAESAEFIITREKTVFLRPISVQEAVLEMNLVGHTFYLFNNSETNQISVIYRRKDGNYGIIAAE